MDGARLDGILVFVSACGIPLARMEPNTGGNNLYRPVQTPYGSHNGRPLLGLGMGSVDRSQSNWTDGQGCTSGTLDGKFDFGLDSFGSFLRLACLAIFFSIHSGWLFSSRPYLNTSHRIDGNHHLLPGAAVGTGVVPDDIQSRVAQRQASLRLARAHQGIRVVNLHGSGIERRCGRCELVG